MGKRKGFNQPLPKVGNRFQVGPLEHPPNYDEYKPLFSLRHMPYQGPCSISECQRDERSDILNKMQKLSQATWGQIKGWKKEMGFEPIPRHRFKIGLPTILTPEVTILVARYNQEGRIAGFREKDIYHIVVVGTDLYSH